MLIDLQQTIGNYFHDVFVNNIDWWVLLGVVAQGLLQSLAVLDPNAVWGGYGSWMRTRRPGVPPSERVVGLALRNALPEFLAGAARESILAKFIRERIDLGRAEGATLAS